MSEQDAAGSAPARCEVARVELSPGLGERLEAEQLPLVIAGGATRWPAIERWSPSYLAGLPGTALIEYQLST
jgi:hypothetical protein